MTTQCVSREDRLFVLATVLRQKGLTPDSNLYKTTIVKINGANFHLPPARIDELTKVLTSSYKADRWASILGEPHPDKIELAPTIPKYNSPITSPRQDAGILKAMARRDTYDGVGRLIQKEIVLELGTFTPQQIIELWQKYNTKDTIEATEFGYLIYWGGKEEVNDRRSNRTPITVNEKAVFQKIELPKETLEKADFMAENGLTGDVEEETEGSVEDESDNEN